MNRNKAIDKAIKLKALADRGIDGEKVNAKSQLERVMREHKLTETDIDTETEIHEVVDGWNVRTDKKKFDVNEIVLVHQRINMVVVETYISLSGWRYVLRFIKKDGTPDKRQSACNLTAKDIQKFNIKSFNK